MRRAALALAALAMLGLTACSSDKKPASWEAGAGAGASSAPAPAAAAAAESATRAPFAENPDGTVNRSPGAQPAASNSKINAGGLGPYRIGVTLQTLQSAKLVTAVTPAKSCDNYTTAQGVTKYHSPQLVFFKGKLLHLSIGSPSITTDKGIKIGSPLANVRSSYPGDKQLDDWTGGSAWLAMTGDYALLFPVRDGKVSQVQAGMAEPLQFKYTDNQGC